MHQVSISVLKSLGKLSLQGHRQDWIRKVPNSDALHNYAEDYKFYVSKHIRADYILLIPKAFLNHF